MNEAPEDEKLALNGVAFGRVVITRMDSNSWEDKPLTGSSLFRILQAQPPR